MILLVLAIAFALGLLVMIGKVVWIGLKVLGFVVVMAIVLFYLNWLWNSPPFFQ